MESGLALFGAWLVIVLVVVPLRLAFQRYCPESRFKRLLLWKIGGGDATEAGEAIWRGGGEPPSGRR